MELIAINYLVNLVDTLGLYCFITHYIFSNSLLISYMSHWHNQRFSTLKDLDGNEVATRKLVNPDFLMKFMDTNYLVDHVETLGRGRHSVGRHSERWLTSAFLNLNCLNPNVTDRRSLSEWRPFGMAAGPR